MLIVRVIHKKTLAKVSFLSQLSENLNSLETAWYSSGDLVVKCHPHLGARLANDGFIWLVVDLDLWNFQDKLLFDRRFEWQGQIFIYFIFWPPRFCVKLDFAHYKYNWNSSKFWKSDPRWPSYGQICIICDHYKSHCLEKCHAHLGARLPLNWI